MIIWDSSIFEEVDWSPLKLHKFGDGYVFNTRHGLEYDDVVRNVNTEGLRALADAIYAELGLGWLPYPENKPSIKDRGDVLCTMCEKDYEEDTWLAILYYAPDKDAFSDEDGTYTSDTPIRVLAISNVQPYQPA